MHQSRVLLSKARLSKEQVKLKLFKVLRRLRHSFGTNRYYRMLFGRFPLRERCVSVILPDLISIPKLQWMDCAYMAISSVKVDDVVLA
jgi:hypothetical protein